MMHTLGQEQETFLGVLPYFHIYGLTTCLTWPTSMGATLAPFPRYVPLDVLKGIQKLKPTVFPGAVRICVPASTEGRQQIRPVEHHVLCLRVSPHAGRTSGPVQETHRRSHC